MRMAYKTDFDDGDGTATNLSRLVIPGTELLIEGRSHVNHQHIQVSFALYRTVTTRYI